MSSLPLWKPVAGNLLTRWAEEIDLDRPWPEYPRPQMRRKDWQSLNGLWEFGIQGMRIQTPPVFSNRILVPYPIESALSGVKGILRPVDKAWYRRIFRVPEAWSGRHVLLHFEAVDWETSVWVNENSVGVHRGGYLPFWFDITDYLCQGDNQLTVSVWDPTDAYWQQHGKQSLKPNSIWYSAVSGIWQSVWMEPVPCRAITNLNLVPDIDHGSIKLKVDIYDFEHRNIEREKIQIKIHNAENELISIDAVLSGDTVEIKVPDPSLWSPDAPYLYSLSIESETDCVQSYFGMRKFSLGRDQRGRKCICLNNKPLFLFGPLDQGYWPDGLYTPPSEAAMKFDLEMIKSLGFNMLRKHVKVEPARYYYLCDQLGIVVWQDMVNGGAAVGAVPSFLTIHFGSRRKDRNYRYAGRSSLASRQDFKSELRALVDHLGKFTCLGIWTIFNEGWGQFDANTITDWLKNYDPTRLVDQASGWWDQGGGDFHSLHVYFKKIPSKWPEKERARVLSEFGGYSLKIEGHVWKPDAEFGYKKFSTKEELTEAYLALLGKELVPCIESGLSAAVYTQTSDVEMEVNGFITYDRAMEKMDFDRCRKAHQGIIGSTIEKENSA